MAKTKTKCETPIFIVGCPRSGTTILASILNRHSRVASATETHFFNFIAKNNYDWKQFDLENFKRLLEESRISDFISLVNVDQDTLIKEFQNINNEKLDANLGVDDFYKKQTFDTLMNILLEKRHKFRFCEKTPQHLQNVAEIIKLYPCAKFIHIVRDGRDTVNSLLKMPWRPNGLVNNARFWVHYAKLGQEQQKLFPENILTVRYEELLRDPETNLKAICKFIDEKFEPAMLKESSSDMEIFSPWESAWKHKAQQGLDAGRIGAWSKELDADDQAILNYLLRKPLVDLGYQVPVVKLSSKQGLKLALEYLQITWRKVLRLVFHVVN